MSGGQGIALGSASIGQLRNLEKSLDDDNTLLTANFNQLKMAQQKFAEAASVVSTLTPDKKGAPLSPALRSVQENPCL